MTFSIVGRCRRSGLLGVGITTSSICVGARCPHARAGVGAVATQNITDPALGPAVLDQIEHGHDAQSALREVMRDRPHLDYRQVTVIDHHGNTACHSGSQILGIHAESAANDCFSAGNLLASDSVITRIVRSFEQNHEDHLAERLLKAIETGLEAGGEQGDVHSAALLVVDRQSFPLVDLRVDWDDNDPVKALRNLWRDYQPQMDDYLTRALDPTNAPSYGVPGDEKRGKRGR
jgi:uncharacterized Ntn-hydrolase superfamily protein